MGKDFVLLGCFGKNEEHYLFMLNPIDRWIISMQCLTFKLWSEIYPNFGAIAMFGGLNSNDSNVSKVHLDLNHHSIMGILVANEYMSNT